MKIRNILLGIIVVVAAAAAVSILWRERWLSVGDARNPPRSVQLPVAEKAPTLAMVAAQPAVVLSSTAANPTRENHLRELARSYARADVAGAVAWLRTLSPADAGLALDEIFSEIGRDDPAGALALGQALGYGTADGRMEHIAQMWTEAEPAAAVAWVTAQAPGAERDRLLARVALVRVSQDPAEAARLLGAMTDGGSRDAAIAATIARLRIYDPAKADAWQALLARN